MWSPLQICCAAYIGSWGNKTFFLYSHTFTSMSLSVQYCCSMFPNPNNLTFLISETVCLSVCLSIRLR